MRCDSDSELRVRLGTSHRDGGRVPRPINLRVSDKALALGSSALSLCYELRVHVLPLAVTVNAAAIVTSHLKQARVL